MEISHDAKIPEIVWKFRRACGQIPSILECPDNLTRNPHFYPNIHQRHMGVQPLGGIGASAEGQRWTDHILVYGDDATGCTKLTSEDGSISRIYRTITHDLVTSGLTIFKGPSDIFSNSFTINEFLDEKGILFKEEEVRYIFKGGQNIKCFFWQSLGFVEDSDAKTLQDVINRRRVSVFRVVVLDT